MDTIKPLLFAHDHIATTLVVGLGSPHGDDCIGWIMLEKLKTLLPAAFRLRSLLSPIDLLNHLNGIRLLHVIDACRVSALHTSVADIDPLKHRLLRMQWPCDELPSYGWSSSHSIPLPAVLELASSLGVLPETVVIWGAIGMQFGAGTEPSYVMSSCVERWTRQIECELVGLASEPDGAYDDRK